MYTGLYHHFYMANVYILKERNSISCAFVGAESYRGEAYTKGGKDIFFMRKPCFALFYFMLFFSLLYGALSYFYYLYFVALIASCLCVGHAYILMPLWLYVQMIFCFSIDHCSNFHMTVMYLIKFLIYFTSCLLYCIFTCYIILVILLLTLPWKSNVFCASILGYRYICSKFITCFRFRCEWVLPLFPNSRLSLESVIRCFVLE